MTEGEASEVILYPKSEIEARIKKLKSKMGEMDGVLIFQLTDFCYFSGTSQEGLLHVPKEGEPTVMIRKSVERAMKETPLEVKPLKSFRTLKEELAIPDGGAIGLEMDVLPTSQYLRLQKALSDVDLQDASEPIKNIRAVKSDFEIGLLRESAKMIDKGISSVPEYLKEGMKEVELAARVEVVLRSLGHQGTLFFRRFNHNLFFGHIISGADATVPSFVASPTGGKGLSLMHPQGAGFKKIQRNEPVLVDYVGCYNGYLADEARIFCLGELSEEFRQAHQAGIEVQKVVEKGMVPGANTRDVFEAAEAKAQELGYDNLGGPPGGKCGFVGHGVGLEIDEYPVIAAVDQTLEKGMAVAVEPKMIFPGKGVVGVEDTFVINDDKSERITRLDQEIWRV
jgi:Xaa-Pro aminopeptidase